MQMAEEVRMLVEFDRRVIIAGLALLMALAFVTTSTKMGAQSGSACVDPTSTYSHDLKINVATMVSLSDTASANERARFGLPALTANQVSIVSDTTACRAASVAYDAAVSATPIDLPVVVLTLGTKRLVVKKYRL